MAGVEGLGCEPGGDEGLLVLAAGERVGLGGEEAGGV